MVSVTIPAEPLPFEAAEKYFADKVPLPPGVYGKLREEAQSRAFALAGVAKMDVLQTVHGELARAIREGTTLADFKKGVRDIAEDRGWTSFRLETMFRTNVGAAYEAGHWAQLKELGDGAVVVYDAIDDSDTRPAHAAMDRKAFAAADPIWNTWWPPNGFNCRCTTQTMSAEEAEVRGIQVEPTSEGLPQPDPGFQHNPGQTFFGGLKPEPGKNLTEMEGLPGPSEYGRPLAKNVPLRDMPVLREEDLLPLDLPEPEYWKALHDTFGFGPGEELVKRDPLGDPSILSDALFQTREGESKIMKQKRQQFVKLLPTLLEDPYEIWLTPMQDALGRVFLRKRYVRVWGTPSKDRVGALAIVEQEKGRWVGVSTFHRNPDKDIEYIDRKIRRGVLLFPK